MSLSSGLPTQREIDEAVRKSPPQTAALCRLIEADFEDGSITLRALASRLPPLSAGNYVVMRQDEWVVWKERAASADTLPKGQDAKQGLAGTESGAVPNEDSGDAQTTQPNQDPSHDR